MTNLRTGRLAYIRKYVLTVLLSLVLSALMIKICTDNSPIDIFVALIRGSIVGKKNIGTTLTGLTTLLLNAVAFSIANKAGF